MKKHELYKSKHWIVFPFAIVIHTDLMEFYPPAKSIEVHFLIWHWRWIIYREKRGCRNE